MKLSEHDRIILQEVIKNEGNCLDGNRCQVCPFKADCLYSFLGGTLKAYTPNQRLQRALNAIVNDIVMQDGLAENLECLTK